MKPTTNISMCLVWMAMYYPTAYAKLDGVPINKVHGQFKGRRVQLVYGDRGVLLSVEVGRKFAKRASFQALAYEIAGAVNGYAVARRP